VKRNPQNVRRYPAGNEPRRAHYLLRITRYSLRITYSGCLSLSNHASQLRFGHPMGVATMGTGAGGGEPVAAVAAVLGHRSTSARDQDGDDGQDNARQK